MTLGISIGLALCLLPMLMVRNARAQEEVKPALGWVIILAADYSYASSDIKDKDTLYYKVCKDARAAYMNAFVNWRVPQDHILVLTPSGLRSELFADNGLFNGLDEFNKVREVNLSLITYVDEDGNIQNKATAKPRLLKATRDNFRKHIQEVAQNATEEQFVMVVVSAHADPSSSRLVNFSKEDAGTDSQLRDDYLLVEDFKLSKCKAKVRTVLLDIGNTGTTAYTPLAANAPKDRYDLTSMICPDGVGIPVIVSASDHPRYSYSLANSYLKKYIEKAGVLKKPIEKAGVPESEENDLYIPSSAFLCVAFQDLIRPEATRNYPIGTYLRELGSAVNINYKRIYKDRGQQETPADQQPKVKYYLPAALEADLESEIGSLIGKKPAPTSGPITLNTENIKAVVGEAPDGTERGAVRIYDKPFGTMYPVGGLTALQRAEKVAERLRRVIKIGTIVESDFVLKPDSQGQHMVCLTDAAKAKISNTQTLDEGFAKYGVIVTADKFFASIKGYSSEQLARGMKKEMLTLLVASKMVAARASAAHDAAHYILRAQEMLARNPVPWTAVVDCYHLAASSKPTLPEARLLLIETLLAWGEEPALSSAKEELDNLLTDFELSQLSDEQKKRLQKVQSDLRTRGAKG